MKRSLLALCVCFFSAAFGQIVPVGQGVPYVFGTVGTIGREIKRADDQRKLKEQQDELDNNYFNLIAAADTLYVQKQYEQAIATYNEALRIKQEQYPKDQIAKANTELARVKQDQYQLEIDKGDSLFKQLKYPLAIERYRMALAIRRDQYALDQIEKAEADMLRSKKVLFSGLIISDERNDEISSKAYSDDPFSDYLSPGNYIYLYDALTYSNFQTLDGIAVPPNTRLIIYSDPGQKGKVLLDVSGPAIINNISKKQIEAAQLAHTKTFSPAALQELFPQNVRFWSETDMQTWIKGSMQIIIF